MESLKSCGETMENRRIPTPKIAYHSLKFCIYSILRSIKNRKTNPMHSVTDLYGECLLRLAKHINAMKELRILVMIGISRTLEPLPHSCPPPGLSTVPA